jgi:sulfane dehydrogenase subunit SoxC
MDKNRRRFIAEAVALSGAALAPGAASAAPSPRALGQGVDPSGYGQRSRFEKVQRFFIDTATPHGTAVLTPLDHYRGIITPSALHFERHHAGVPEIDPATHQLLVHGLVERPMVFTMADLRRYPTVSRVAFLECAGNTSTEPIPAIVAHVVADTHGATSTSEWAGLSLSTLLREVGVKPEGKWVLAEGADACLFTRSVPLEKCLDDAMLAYEQNGEALRPAQGYPLRLLLPGWEGASNVKWLRRLEITSEPLLGRDETVKFTGLDRSGKTHIYDFEMPIKSAITAPSGKMKLPGKGFVEITGLAWTGAGLVSRVEVSVDGGKTWSEAVLQEPRLPKCHTRFRFPWVWDGKAAVLQSRAYDEQGRTQPTREAWLKKRGFYYSYHYNAIQSWAVDPDGNVQNVHA